MVGDEPVRSVIAAVGDECGIDHRNLVAVHLLGGGEEFLSQPELGTKRAMGGIEAFQRRGSLGCDIDPGNAPEKGMPNETDFLKRGKKFQH